MGDSPTGRHQVELARANHLLGAERIAVERFSLEEPRHGGQTDVRMWPDLQWIRVVSDRWADQIDEAPGADRAPALGGQDTRDTGSDDIGRPALPHLDTDGAFVDPPRVFVIERTAHGSSSNAEPTRLRRSGCRAQRARWAAMKSRYHHPLALTVRSRVA